MAKIGRAIAGARRERGLTQAELAERFNITDRAVAKWEAGKSLPSPDIIVAVADTLGLEVADLLGGHKGDAANEIVVWGTSYCCDEPQPCVVALGSFDGLHQGDRALLAKAYSQARDLGVRLAAVTFERTPEEIAGGASFECRRLTTDRARWCGLVRFNERTFGRRCLSFAVPDTDASRAQSAAELLDSLASLMDIRAVHISAELRCGARGACDAEGFRALCEKRGLPCEVHRAYHEGVEITAAAVADLVAAGDIDRADALLAGCLHRYSGEVRSMIDAGGGFLSLELVSESRRRVVPAAGVYAGYVVVRRDDGEHWRAMHLVPAAFSVAPGGNDPAALPETRVVVAASLAPGPFEVGETLDMLFVRRLAGSPDGSWPEIEPLQAAWPRDNLESVVIAEEWDLVLFGSEQSE